MCSKDVGVVSSVWELFCEVESVCIKPDQQHVM
jgi:hypothetical protein